MKHHHPQPFGKDAAQVPKRSAEPEKLPTIAEDPIQEHTDNRAEQKVAFKKAGHADPRVQRDEADQGRTR